MKLNLLIISFLISFSSLAQVSFLPNSLSLEFEESYVSSISKKIKKSFGKLDYKYPGHIRFEKISPEKLEFICNPTTSWYYTPAVVEGEEGQVIIQKSSGFVVGKFLDSLKGGLKTTKDYDVKIHDKDIGLTFKNIKEAELKQAIIHSNKLVSDTKQFSDVNNIELIYVDGRKVTLRLLSVKENVSFAVEHFNFKVPAKTKIVDKRK